MKCQAIKKLDFDRAIALKENSVKNKPGTQKLRREMVVCKGEVFKFILLEKTY